jgi:hypothetical protein
LKSVLSPLSKVVNPHGLDIELENGGEGMKDI